MNARSGFIQGLGHVAQDLGVSAEEKVLVAGIGGGITVSSNDPEVIAWVAELRPAGLDALPPALAKLKNSADAVEVAGHLSSAMNEQIANGFTGQLPSWVKRADGNVRVIEQPAWLELVGAFDQVACAEVVGEMLKHSQCPIVRRLRVAIVNAYCANNLPQVCEAAGVPS